MDRCDSCEFEYGSVTSESAADRVRREAVRLAELLTAAAPERLRRGSAGVWSPVQYAGHVRDVLLVQRERVLTTRMRPDAPAVPMGREERVSWGEYDDAEPHELAADVVRAAGWLAHTLEILPETDWSLTLRYNYPEPAERTLRWLAAHTVHELVHHREDIRRLLRT